MISRQRRHASRSRARTGFRPFAEALEARTVPSFLPPVHYGAGTMPNIPNVGDLNQDGILDIAVDNAEGGNVSVYLGNGDGTFQDQVIYATGPRPYSLTIADINVDSLPDLVTANVGNGTVSVLLGNGDGTFQAPIHSAAGPNAEDAKAGDFNGDKLPDLAVPLFNAGGGVVILLGNGDGTFQPPVRYATGANSAFMVLGDVNGDSALDLLVPNFNGNSVSVLLGNGDGTFQDAINHAAGPLCVMVDVGDFNQDKILDMAVANSPNPNGSVTVLLGNGDGTFGAPTSYPVGAVAQSVAVGDLNLDGILDLIVASNGAGVTVYLGLGDGTFDFRMDFEVLNTPAATVGDLDGDGWLDVVVANFDSRAISVLINDQVWGEFPNPGSGPGKGWGSWLVEDLTAVESAPPLPTLRARSEEGQPIRTQRFSDPGWRNERELVSVVDRAFTQPADGDDALDQVLWTWA